MKIVGGTANEPLTQKIAQQLGISVSEREIFIFPDGERRVRVLGNFVGEIAIAVQPTAPPADTNYMELFFLVDALKRSGAEFVTAVVPYLGYQRQDHVFRDGEAVSMEVIVKTMQSVGMDRIISVDLHTPKIPDVFTIPMTHLSALPLFAQKIQALEDMRPAVLISPDMGGIRRIKILSEMLTGMPYGAIEKNRDLATGTVTASKFGEGSIHGAKRAFIVDDMIASGKTIVTAAQVLLDAGIEEIYVFATHAIFAKEAPELLENSVAKKIFVTDTVFIPEDKVFPKLEVLSVAGLIADQLRS